MTLAVGGPGSMIGFDFARTFNPAHRLGTATGIVNVGGFIAALVSIYLIGLMLDLLHASGFSQGELYGLDSFRVALSVQFLLLAGGAIAPSSPPGGKSGARWLPRVSWFRRCSSLSPRSAGWSRSAAARP